MTMERLCYRVKPSDAGRGCKIENRAPAAGRARPALCGIKRQDAEVRTSAGRQGGRGGWERCHRFYGMSARDIKPKLDPEGGTSCSMEDHRQEREPACRIFGDCSMQVLSGNREKSQRQDACVRACAKGG
jgi:hypothetical protein